MKKAIPFLAAIIALTISAELRALPANPFPQRVTQADGGVVTITGRGDEFFNWAEDQNGYVVAFDGNSKNWKYAYVSDDGRVLPGDGVLGGAAGTAAGISAAPPQRITAADLETLIRRADSSRDARVTYETSGAASESASDMANSSAALSAMSLAASDNMNPALLPILIEYYDAQIVKNINYWHGHFFGDAPGQLNHYLDEVSGGKFQYRSLPLNGDANGPVTETLPANVLGIEFFDGVAKVFLAKNHPGTGNAGVTNDAVETDINAAFDAVKAYIDFTPFSYGLESGHIKSRDLAVYAVVAGWEGSNVSNNDTRKVWAHMRPYILSGSAAIASVRYSNLMLRSYAVQGEILTGAMDANATVMGIGAAAHELGHLLGLPDLYDISNNGTAAVGPYSLMASGSWGAGAGESSTHRPTHLDAWSKVHLGFAEFVEITAEEHLKFDMLSVETGNYNVLKVTNAAADPQQYFLIENRGLAGYDAGFYRFGIRAENGNGGGVLIYHIDESVKDNIGRLSNRNWRRRGVAVEPADGSDLLDLGSVTSNAYIWHNHFFSNTPYTMISGNPFGNTGGRDGTFNAFDPSTSPNSDFYDSDDATSFTPSGVYIMINGGRGSIMEVEIGLPPSAPEIAEITLPDGETGTAYDASLTATVTVSAWSVVSGELPDGLTLNKSTGEISGTPNTIGQFDFVVSAVNAAGEDTKVLSILVVKGDPVVPAAPEGLTAVYGQTLADVELPESEGWAWMDETLSVGGAGDRLHKAKFTPHDAENYNVVEDVDVPVTVLKAGPSVQNIPIGLTAEEGDSLLSVPLPAGWSWVDPEEPVGAPGERPHNAAFTPADTANYRILEIELTVTVNQKVAVLSHGREISQIDGKAETAAVAPASGLTPVFVAGPNPVGRSFGAINFYYRERPVTKGALTVYDAAGNAVRGLAVIGGVTTWDLRDSKGRKIAPGTYLVRGTITAANGKRERVSQAVEVR